jgi:hypothetical protein
MMLKAKWLMGGYCNCAINVYSIGLANTRRRSWEGGNERRHSPAVRVLKTRMKCQRYLMMAVAMDVKFECNVAVVSPTNQQ